MSCESMNFTVAIPAKNEARTIGDVVAELLKLYPGADVLVVDDGSEDDTADVAEREGARVVRHPYSKGNGGAIKTAARNSAHEFVVFMDADGQHRPDDVRRLLTRLSEGYDMAIGARRRAGKAGCGRALANGFDNWLAGYVTGHKIEVLTSGFRAVRLSRFKEFIDLLPNGFSYPTTVTMAFFRAGYSVVYDGVDVSQRVGRSHISPLKDGVRFLLIIFKVGTLYSPLKLFLPLSLMFAAFGVAYSVYTLGWKGEFTNMSALLISVSVLIFLIGLVSEQITALTYNSAK